ncbi:hypothetical protein Y032_0514g2771 [Ancylostoma ceylanicum]|nr:hypothetical protein Y032_0514g2771 [Ancylostoma ceylanicum]
MYDFLANKDIPRISGQKPKRYYIRLEYKTTGNDSLSGSTDLFYVRTAEGIPGQVRNLKLNGSKTNLHTKEYAVFPITWDEPSVKKGQIIGYKIRWKLSKLHFDIFVVEQCGKSYEIKVFSHNERYKAFVSAKTIVGYGAETELAFGASVAVATLDAGTMTAVVLSFFCTAIFSS